MLSYTYLRLQLYIANYLQPISLQTTNWHKSGLRVWLLWQDPNQILHFVLTVFTLKCVIVTWFLLCVAWQCHPYHVPSTATAPFKHSILSLPHINALGFGGMDYMASFPDWVHCLCVAKDKTLTDLPQQWNDRHYTWQHHTEDMICLGCLSVPRLFTGNPNCSLRLPW